MAFNLDHGKDVNGPEPVLLQDVVTAANLPVNDATKVDPVNADDLEAQIVVADLVIDATEADHVTEVIVEDAVLEHHQFPELWKKLIAKKKTRMMTKITVLKTGRGWLSY